MIGAFIEGPLWYFASAFFVLGVVWRLISILRAGLPEDPSTPEGSASIGALRTLFSRSLPGSTLLDRGKLVLSAGYMFHLGLFALVFFARPHIDFIAENITGFGWAALPHWGFVVASEVAFIGLILLWLHRLMHPVRRLLTRTDDRIGMALIFFVMLTGCLALAQSFEPLRLIHLLLVEILLIYFPFSNLMHAFTFLLSRGYTGASMGRKGVNA